MTTVLHLYDWRTPPAGLNDLALLRDRRDGVGARVGGQTRADLPSTPHVLRRRWLWALTAAPDIREFADRCGVDVIHCWSPVITEAAASGGRPTVLSVCEPPSARDRRMIRAATIEGAHVMASSALLASKLTREGVDADRVHVVAPAAPPVNLAGSARQDARGRLGIPPDACAAVLIPQSLGDRSGRLAVWAAGILGHMNVKVNLVIPGVGSTVDGARRFAAQIKLQSGVHCPGQLEATDRAALWAAVDMAILYDPVGFGVSWVAQAIAARVPIIASDTGEMASVLRDGESALLVQPDNPRLLSRAIWRLREDPRLVTALTDRAANDLAAMTDVERMLTQVDELYALAAERQPA